MLARARAQLRQHLGEKAPNPVPCIRKGSQ
jgi:hypothetical protein